jgi:hypothetical protein
VKSKHSYEASRTQGDDDEGCERLEGGPSSTLCNLVIDELQQKSSGNCMSAVEVGHRGLSHRIEVCVPSQVRDLKMLKFSACVLRVFLHTRELAVCSLPTAEGMRRQPSYDMTIDQINFLYLMVFPL